MTVALGNSSQAAGARTGAGSELALVALDTMSGAAQGKAQAAAARDATGLRAQWLQAMHLAAGLPAANSAEADDGGEQAGASLRAAPEDSSITMAGQPRLVGPAAEAAKDVRAGSANRISSAQLIPIVRAATRNGPPEAEDADEALPMKLETAAAGSTHRSGAATKGHRQAQISPALQATSAGAEAATTIPAPAIAGAFLSAVPPEAAIPALSADASVAAEAARPGPAALVATAQEAGVEQSAKGAAAESPRVCGGKADLVAAENLSGTSSLREHNDYKLIMSNSQLIDNGEALDKPISSASGDAKAEIARKTGVAADVRPAESEPASARLPEQPQSTEPVSAAALPVAQQVSQISVLPAAGARSGFASGGRGTRIAAVAEGTRAAMHSTAAADAAAPAGPLVTVRVTADSNQPLDWRAAQSIDTAEQAAGNPFSALDATAQTGHVSWTHAGPQHAEAGFADPALGWVAVRADLHAGGIHAAVIAPSTGSATALGGELAGLSTHLAERQIAVQSVSVATANGQESNLGNATQQGGAHESGRDDGQRNAPVNAAPAAHAISSSKEAAAAAGGADLLTPWREGAGTHVSVMA